MTKKRLRWNIHHIKFITFTIFLVYNSVALSTFTLWYNHHHLSISRMLSLSQSETPFPFNPNSHFLLLPALGNLREQNLQAQNVSLCKEDSSRLNIFKKKETQSFSYYLPGFPGGSDGKEPACNGGDPGSIPGSGRSPGEGNGYPLQYSWMENSMDRGAWQSMRSQRVGRNWANNTLTFTSTPSPLTA